MTALKVVCLAGPTGAGKTRAALALARAFRGEVVNYDSRQVYRGVPVTTAQPSREELACCAHHLYGYLDCSQAVSAGAFAQLAARTVQEIAARGSVPILVGGTGLYGRAILDGLAPIPDVPQDVRREAQEQWDRLGPEALHGLLAGVDPQYAARIHPNDRQRVTRAVEVYKATGRTLSSWHEKTAPALEALSLRVGLAVDKAVLDVRLAARIEDMLALGALDEVRNAVCACPQKDAPGLTGIGCAELAAHLRGEYDLKQCKALWLGNTKAYAKRQMTWFKKDGRIRWFSPEDVQQIVEEAGRWLA